MITVAQHGIGRWSAVALLCCALLSATAPRAGATTIEPMSLVTAADYAAQVIDARVLETKARWVENPRRIETVLTLVDVTYLKGESGTESKTFELVVPGGTMGSIRMRIAGAPELRPGDRWILFLLPSYKTHPVVGLTRGAFRIDESTPSTTRVLDASGHGVVAVRRDGTIDVTGEPRTPLEQRLKGADGVRILNPPHRSKRTMTVGEFVAALRPLLAVSRGHHASQPAGQPNPSVLRPTTLRPSQRQRRNTTTREPKALHARTITRTPAGPHAKRRNR